MYIRRMAEHHPYTSQNYTNNTNHNHQDDDEMSTTAPSTNSTPITSATTTTTTIGNNSIKKNDRQQPLLDNKDMSSSASSTAAKESKNDCLASSSSSIPSSDDPLSYSFPSFPLRDAAQVDATFFTAAALSAAVFVLLVALQYLVVPRSDWEYLEGVEQQTAQLAFWILVVAIVLQTMQMYVGASGDSFCEPKSSSSSNTTSTTSWSGIMTAVYMNMAVTLITNGILAFGPTVVAFDETTQARVFLTRWCEWVPLAGLMTYLSEAVDIPNTAASSTASATSSNTNNNNNNTGDHNKYWQYYEGYKWPIFVSVMQSVSCFMAFLFPYASNFYWWLFYMVIAVVTFLTLFPRVWLKRQCFLACSKGPTVADIENWERRRFAYYLMACCAAVWTLLVAMYFTNMFLHVYLPVGHKYRYKSLSMIFDTIFDVIAKVIYLRLIVNVHHRVFSAEGRVRRQLGELRRLLSVLWNSSSDVILISARGSPSGGKTTTLVSPSFTKLLGYTLPESVTTTTTDADNNNTLGSNTNDKESDIALLYEIYRPVRAENPQESQDSSSKIKISFVDSMAMTTENSVPPMNCQASHEPVLVDNGMLLIDAAWRAIRTASAATLGTGGDSSLDKGVSINKNKNSASSAAFAASLSSMLLVEKLQLKDGSECHVEIKVSCNGSNALVAIVRNVTERHKRFEAERRAHAETVARQKDAQNVNRFTRHEVKNGLLAGIELCDSLRSSMDEKESSTAKAHNLQAHAIEMSSSLSSSGQSSPPTGKEINSKKTLNDLDNLLHEVLDTVLAEAMAREVIHEVYRPRLERIDVQSAIMSSAWGVGNDRRFPLVAENAIPNLMLDPQLVKYIHRNAISNSCKYGKQDGVVTTHVRYDASVEMLHIDVINEPGPGHKKILEMGVDAAKAVFKQGSRLHNGFQEDSRISSGDGAWIMQKCAKTLGGRCNIRFEEDQTVFSFECPASAVRIHDWPASTSFRVPSGTWGIAIDDSKIQRKLMNRILTHAGVEEGKRVVLGEDASDVPKLQVMLRGLLQADPHCRFLVLVDENLDFGTRNAKQVLISGSKVMQELLESLPSNLEERLLVLIRSANDSAEDILEYQSRTHGFFPKAPMQQSHVCELLAPLWADRFNSTDSEGDSDGGNSLDSEDNMMRQELRHQLSKIDNILKSGAQNVEWNELWSALHSFKGDFIMLGAQKEIDEIVSMMTAMRGNAMPVDFEEQWGLIREKIVEIL